MRKLGIFILGVLLSFAFAFCGHGFFAVSASATQPIIYIGGMSAGFTLKSGGIQVVGLCEVMTENGVISPALQAGLRTNDRIIKADGVQTETIVQLNAIVEKSNGKKLIVEIERTGENLSLEIIPVKDRTTNRYKIGILARDSVSGIGTVTYVDQTNRRFGALGHSVIGENKKELCISDGVVYACSIIGIHKGIRGRAGELRGMFLNDKPLGTAEKLCNCGIFGKLDEHFDTTDLTRTVATSENACPGKAFIYSTIDGVETKRYAIEIVKVDKNHKENKNYVIKVTDEDLIAQTGGIVQGMSGSPIIQDDKLIGAVTHVFLNDPTRGYGIDIQAMMKEQCLK